MTGIYKITSPSGKIYIGQSVNCISRKNSYRRGCPHQRKLHASIQKYGWDKHIFEIIHVCLESELDLLEKYYVDLFQTFNNKNGLNLKDGGGRNGRHSPETIEKQRASNIGKHIISEETRALMRKNHKGMRGKNHSIESRLLRLNKDKLGVPKKDSHRINLSKSTKVAYEEGRLIKPFKFVLNTINGIFYLGIQEAADTINMNYGTLKCKLQGRRKNNTPFVYA